MRALALIPVVVVFVSLSALRLPAQSVVGRVVEPGVGHGIPAAFITLLGDDDVRLASALSDSVGRFVLRTPAPGRYRLRAERIGHRTTLSPHFTLAAGQRLDYRFEVTLEPIALEGISVRTERQCRVRPEAGLPTARLWEEARKALSVAAWTTDERILVYEVVLYERDLEPRSLRVREERMRPRVAMGTSPFNAEPAEQLSRDGYFQRADDGSFRFFGPDATVLLSETFLADHCFRVRAAPDGVEGVIGLGFEPRRGRNQPDIQGVLWLDVESSELRSIEYSYTRLPRGLDWRELGGRIEFERVPTGEWIVRSWWIRMPRLGIRAGAPAGRDRDGHILLGIRESGGEVVGIRTYGAGGRPSGGSASVAGLVFDTIRGGPLAGATVFVSGTPFQTTTDSLGQFRLEGLPAGEHLISYHHGVLDALDIYPEPLQVPLGNAESRTIQLAVPSLATILARACPDERRQSRGTLVGTVRDARTGRMLPGVEIVIESGTWVRRDAGRGDALFTRTGGSQSVEAAVDGYYRACDLPAREPIQAYATFGGRRSDAVHIRLRAGAVDRHDFTLEIPESRLASIPEATGTLARVEGAGEGARERGAPGALHGRIESAAGAPLVAAVVYLSGTDLTAETDATGGFAFEEVPAGSYSLVWLEPDLDPAGELVEPLGVEVEPGEAAYVVVRVAGLDERLSGSELAGLAPNWITRRDLLFKLARPAGREAQLVGRIFGEDGEPVVNAAVRLLDTDRVQLSDAAGRIVVHALRPGTYVVEASHIGYLASKGTVVVVAGERTEIEVRLATRAIELEGIVVTARRNLLLAPFYDRLSRGVGSFITREAIERRGSGQVSQLLGEAGVEVKQTALIMRRTGCAPMIYLDGVPLTRPWSPGGRDLSPGEAARDAIDLVPPADVEGIEVFHGPAQVPAEFGGSTARCGVIAIWTRRGGR